MVVIKILMAVFLGSLGESAPLFKFIDSNSDPILSREAGLRYPAEINRRQYRPLVLQAAKLTGLKPKLIEVVIKIESNWRVDAVSQKGAQGLMQLMPETARRYGAVSPFDPRQNILAGARYLRDLLDLFKWDLPMAIAAYHAGHNRVLREGRIPNIKATKTYVEAVMKDYRAPALQYN